VAIAASIAGDTSQDLKTGFLLGATPWRQQVGELIGVLTSAIFVCGTVIILGQTYGFGTEELAAPQGVLMQLVIDGVRGDRTALRTALSAWIKTAPEVRFLVHGDEAAINAILSKGKISRDRVEIRHADRVIAMDEKPAQALRRGKGTSMWNAVEAVREGQAAAAVSAGNTGALMAISKLILRMSADLERPALVASIPHENGVSTFLDVGANVDCDAERLVEFAIMGEAFHRAAHGVPRPTVVFTSSGSSCHDRSSRNLKGTALPQDCANPHTCM